MSKINVFLSPSKPTKVSWCLAQEFLNDFPWKVWTTVVLSLLRTENWMWILFYANPFLILKSLFSSKSTCETFFKSGRRGGGGESGGGERERHFIKVTDSDDCIKKHNSRYCWRRSEVKPNCLPGVRVLINFIPPNDWNPFSFDFCMLTVTGYNRDPRGIHHC